MDTKYVGQPREVTSLEFSTSVRDIILSSIFNPDFQPRGFRNDLLSFYIYVLGLKILTCKSFKSSSSPAWSDFHFGVIDFTHPRPEAKSRQKRIIKSAESTSSLTRSRQYFRYHVWPFFDHRLTILKRYFTIFPSLYGALAPLGFRRG